MTTEEEMQLEAVVREAFAAGQEQMRNRAAVVAMEMIRSRGQYLHPVNLMGSVGQAICDLGLNDFPRRGASKDDAS